MRRLIELGLLTLILGATGCGSSQPSPSAPDARERMTLNDVGELYRIAQVTLNRPPKSEKDVQLSEMAAPTGMDAIKNKQVVVLWGATLPNLGEEPGVGGGSDQVLAYEAKVPDEGGLVLMLDRTVKSMTPAEFKAAPRPAGAEVPAGK